MKGFFVNCYCQSSKEYSVCCEPYIENREKAPTAEALMRSRYTAHVLCKLDYIEKTMAPETRKDFDAKGVMEWSKNSEWLGLEILSAKENVVEFIAKFRHDGKVIEHHEVSQFRRDPKSGEWFFIDGESHAHEEGKGHHHHQKIAPVVREEPKIGRNDPCSCGSGKKYKKCHGA